MSKIIPNFLEVVPATLREYETLACYHYRTESLKPATGVFKVRAKHPYTDSVPDPLAVIVYRMPIINLTARNKATENYFLKPQSQVTRAKLVCKKIRYIARVIVDPRFRRKGIATQLITETLKLQRVPIVETLIPIDFATEMFKKIGFELHYAPSPKWYRRFDNALREIGIEPETLLLASTLQNRLEYLSKNQTTFIEHEIKQFLHHFRRHDNMKPGPERSAVILRKFSYPNAYLIWYNPKYNFSSKSRPKIQPTPTWLSPAAHRG